MGERVYTVLSFFCGLGGKTLGFQAAETRLFGATQRFRSLGGIDSDPEACEDFR
ncbi:MAG: DNA cytosine methyltransferase, partial [Candidatus Competibacteraceae bacterium]|nr:DNA cytosine methyltransferase [Candidatus Competibacteraceae bacterium]